MPEVDPDGVEGVFGGLFAAIVTFKMFDHPELAPRLSVALALTLYVPTLLQA